VERLQTLSGQEEMWEEATELLREGRCLKPQKLSISQLVADQSTRGVSPNATRDPIKRWRVAEQRRVNACAKGEMSALGMRGSGPTQTARGSSRTELSSETLAVPDERGVARRCRREDPT
jgi:hypothetical protein